MAYPRPQPCRPALRSAFSARSRKDCDRLKIGRSLIRRLRRAKRAMAL